ncbi:TetR family transcriptional regulator C-terminal domain-containing protein [Leifsonia xyli]|uniref:TetR family transcriptional regulator C-terminal domain-containing protein n=1 Tax=Leifsonia xyli TaxID=1575 RepID=UPI003D675074
MGRTPEQRLRILLEWMLPLTPADKRRETGRVMMASERSSDLKVQNFYTAMDTRMRGLLREHLAPFVGSSELDDTVESLRVFFNGIVLSAVERPNKWTRKRQLEALYFAMRGLGLPVG